MSEIRELVMQAIGEASMCWSETPKGIFESDKALDIGERIITRVKELETAIKTADPIALGKIKNELEKEEI